MTYFKNRIKKDVEIFEFDTKGQLPTEEFLEQYKNIKALFKRCILYLTDFKNTYNLKKKDADNKKNQKKSKKSKTKKEDTKISYLANNEFNKYIEASLQDLLDFYDACDVFALKIIKEIFKKPLAGKKNLFEILNKLFKMYYIFDITRYNHADIFHELALYKKSLNKNESSISYEGYENILLRRSSFLGAVSQPMGHLFISGFVSPSKSEIYTPTDLIKRTSILLDRPKKEHLYFLASLMCKMDSFKYCRIFLVGLYNRFFYSKRLIKHIDIMKKQNQAYYVALTNLK